MKIINRILDFILISYFLSLIIFLVVCFIVPEKESAYFQAFFMMTELFRLILGVIFVILISKINEVSHIKREIHNCKEVN